MKELSIEEKAKAYDEAIERARKEYKNHESFLGFCEMLVHIFPELKESEDESIRKSIIGFLITISSLRDGKTVSNEDFDSKAILEWAAWLEKQSDQKPADKSEPKFKVGLWVTNGIDCVFQIASIEDGMYYDTNNCGSDIESTDKAYHLWTIQDAKDGDVLATDSWLYIFKYTNNKALIQFHCTCPINGKPYKWCFLSDDSYLDIAIDANIHPATKEQRNLLFQKMKEAGYEWDANKRELKKIIYKTQYYNWL